MTRRETFLLLVVAVVFIAGGLVWLFGPYGLVGSGVALLALALFGVDVKEQGRRGEAVATADRFGE